MTDSAIVTFLLDRSGSMEACKSATIEAFNAYLAGLKAPDENGEPDILFNFLQFDSLGLDKVCTNRAIQRVEDLNYATYQPRGGTPLYDAAYKTIKAVEAAVAANPGRKVIICIQTDGQENESREYTLEQLNDLIKEKVALGWQFNFMGASLDAYKIAASLGIRSLATLSYNAQSAAATKAGFTANARNTRSYMAGQAATTDFLARDRADAQDAYWGGQTGQAPTTPNVVTGSPVLPSATVLPPAPAAMKRPPAPSATARRPVVEDIDLGSTS